MGKFIVDLSLPPVRRRGYPLTVASPAITAALAPPYVVRWHVGFYPTTALEAGILRATKNHGTASAARSG
jgi:hypothetical protein